MVTVVGSAGKSAGSLGAVLLSSGCAVNSLRAINVMCFYSDIFNLCVPNRYTFLSQKYKSVVISCIRLLLQSIVPVSVIRVLWCY